MTFSTHPESLCCPQCCGCRDLTHERRDVPSPVDLPTQTLHITYVLLSPTFGMHQYTADLANRLADAGHQVDLVTTSQVPRDRYSPHVRIVAPLNISGTGFNRQGLWAPGLARILASPALGQADLVHITGVHLWNVPLVWTLRQRGLPVVHTLHDLEPHHGVRFGRLIRLWNRLIIRSATHVLVHGERYQAQLIAGGVDPTRVTCLPLLHGFWGYGAAVPLAAAPYLESAPPGDAVGEPMVLFFGRVEQYKGVDVLLQAWHQVRAAGTPARLVIAGPGASDVVLPPLPAGVELRNRRIADAEAMGLFAECDLLVLPYRDATQSALIAAAYVTGRPVLATRTGALPEYIVEGQTGWVVPPGDAPALALGLQTALADRQRLTRMGTTARAWYDDQRSSEWPRLLQMYRGMQPAQTGFA